MGYEAYKITAKFRDTAMEDLITALRGDGAVFAERFGGTVTMEIANEHGFIELVLREETHVNMRFSPSEKVLLTIRFAKVNDVRLTGCVIALLKRLSAKFETVYIRDHESDRDIDLRDTAWLMKSVTYAKYDFEYHYPVRRHLVRCRDVFCRGGYDYPRATAEELR